MMGVLVNSRRGGRAPPLLMAALVGCMLLLGFNYWVSTSRNVELQTKLFELEERVRRAAAEREREQLSRNEAEEQVRRQTEQLTLMENTHQRQQQSAENGWKQEKEKLFLNISSTAKTVQELKNEMKNLLEHFSKVQIELQSCQSNMNTLNKKLTYDMTQCNTQILAVKEDCNEKMEAARLEAQKKYERQSVTAANQKAPVNATKPESQPVALTSVSMNKSMGEAPNPKTENHLKSNEIPENRADVAVQATSAAKLVTTATPKESNQNRTRNNLTNQEAMAGVMDIKGADLKAADALLDAAVNQGEKEDAAIEYDNEGEIEKRLSKLKDDKAAAQEFEDELADYNGDDENEPEFEGNKQVELAEV